MKENCKRRWRFNYRIKMFIRYTMLVGVLLLCLYVFSTTAFNHTLKSNVLDGLERFHQFYLKGQFVYIPSNETDDITKLRPLEAVTPKPKGSLCHTFIGRLGNIMFQYASLYSIAKANRLNLVTSHGFTLSSIFSNVPKYSTNFRPCLKYTKLFERNAYRFEKSVTKLDYDANYMLEGFLQSWKYFKPYEQDLRHQFTFLEPIRRQADFSLNAALESFRKFKRLDRPFDVFIGIHVRRGDYTKLFPPNKKRGVNLPTKEYFKRAKEYFYAQYSYPIFVVCSDDILWCERNIDAGDSVFIRGNLPEVDQAILSSLNHTITSFGTFSFWAAWLANGTTLYPKDIIDDNLLSQKELYLSNYIYPTWIPV